MKTCDIFLVFPSVFGAGLSVPGRHKRRSPPCLPLRQHNGRHLFFLCYKFPLIPPLEGDYRNSISSSRSSVVLERDFILLPSGKVCLSREEAPFSNLPELPLVLYRFRLIPRRREHFSLCLDHVFGLDDFYPVHFLGQKHPQMFLVPLMNSVCISPRPIPRPSIATSSAPNLSPFL